MAPYCRTDHPKWMRDMWSEQTAAVSQNVISADLNTKLDFVPPELEHVKPGGTLFVTFATKSVEDFVVTWLESAKRLKLEPIFVARPVLFTCTLTCLLARLTGSGL